MTDKIIKMAHSNTVYDLSSSQDDNFQMLKLKDSSGADMEATIYLQKINNNWASFNIAVNYLKCRYNSYVFTVNGVKSQFIPSLSTPILINVNGNTIEVKINANNTITLESGYTPDPIPSRDTSKPSVSYFYRLK